MISRKNVENKISRSEYKTLLFDFDGTLVDTVPQIVNSFQHVFLSLTGEKGDEKEILSTIGMPLEQAFYMFDETLREDAVANYRVHNKSRLNTGVGIFLGINKMLETLKLNNINLAVVTSKRYDSARMTAEYFDIYKYFDVFISRDSTVKHKPDPEPIEKAVSEFLNKGIPKDEIKYENILFVGDSIHDLSCAKNAGIACAIVDWTYMDKEEIMKNNPDYWINKPSDIYSLCGINIL